MQNSKMCDHRHFEMQDCFFFKKAASLVNIGLTIQNDRPSTFSIFPMLKGEISNSKNMVSIIICPKVDIHLKKNQKNNLTVPLRVMIRVSEWGKD